MLILQRGGYRVYRPWKTENKMLAGTNSCELKVYTNIEALNELFYGPQMFGGLTIMVWNKLYKTELLKNMDNFLEGYIQEDLEFTPRSFYLANKIAKYEKDIYTYNIHLGKDSSSGMKTCPLKIDSPIVACESLEKFFTKHYVDNISNHISRLYYNNMMNGYYQYWLLEKKEKKYKDKLLELKTKLELNKVKIKQLNPGWKTNLFFESTYAYCVMVNIYRTLKKIKYGVKTIITGKN